MLVHAKPRQGQVKRMGPQDEHSIKPDDTTSGQTEAVSG